MSLKLCANGTDLKLCANGIYITECSCPTNCNTCPTSYTIEISGFTGSCASKNGTYTVVNSCIFGTCTCSWTYQGNRTLECISGGVWREQRSGLYIDAENGCPKPGTYTGFSDPIECGEATAITLVIS